MGTNYYLHVNCCEHCRRPERVIHIGKSSMGWAFALHVGKYSWDEQPADLEGWKNLWSEPKAIIKNEYGDEISPADLMDIIAKREFGVHKLARHGEVDGDHCIGHGEGTWDLIIGDFT